MKQFFSIYEQFVLKAFNFQGRATPLEYWGVILLVWLIIMYTLMGDIAEVHTFLLAREIPPMNPLYYDSFIVFVLTLIPRLSLNMRRLHDRDRTGFWVIIPAIAILSGIALFSGLAGAMMNSSLTGVSNNPDDPMNILHPFILLLTAPYLFWEEMFAIAAAFQSAGSETIATLISEIYAQNGGADIRRSSSNVSVGIAGNTGHTWGFVFVVIALVVTPVVTTVWHLILNVLPTAPVDNIYGPAQIAQLQYKKKKDNTHNPMAGYACLFEETEEEKARKREKGAAEVKELYRQRVLGNQ